eukprot:2884933-Rhodomonas_salina.2
MQAGWQEEESDSSDEEAKGGGRQKVSRCAAKSNAMSTTSVQFIPESQLISPCGVSLCSVWAQARQAMPRTEIGYGAQVSERGGEGGDSGGGRGGRGGRGREGERVPRS